MTPQARLQFEQWKHRYSGTRLIVPHQPSPSGELLKCPACGSTKDFVLYVERPPGCGVPKVNKEKHWDVAIYLKCFAPVPHLGGSSTYNDFGALSQYLKEGERFIPVEYCELISEGSSAVRAWLQLAPYFLLFSSIYYFATKGGTGIILIILLFASAVCFLIVNRLQKPRSISSSSFCSTLKPVSANLVRDLDFLKASRRIRSWTQTHYAHGKIMEKGNELRNMKSAQEAVELLKKTIVEEEQEAKALSARWALAISHLELGFLYRMTNTLDKAKNHLHEAADMLHELDFQTGNRGVQKDLGTALYRLAEVHHVSGEDRQALDEYKESLEIIESLGDQSTAKVIKEQIRMILSKAQK